MQTNPTKRHKKAYSINGFCDAVSVGRTLAYKEIAAGNLRTKKAGRKRLITEEEADRWLQSLPDG